MKILRRLTLALGLAFAGLAVPEPAHAGYSNGTIVCFNGDSVKVTATSSGLTYIYIEGFGNSFINTGVNFRTLTRTESLAWSRSTFAGLHYVNWAVFGIGHPHRWASAQCVR